MKRVYKKFDFLQIDKPQLVAWASGFDPCVILDSFSTHNMDYPNGFTYELVIGISSYADLTSNINSFDRLKDFHTLYKDWMLGYLSYDLKNEIESLRSDNLDFHFADHLHFFIPKIIILVQKNCIEIGSLSSSPDDIWQQIKMHTFERPNPIAPITLISRIDYSQYIAGVIALQEHIQMGDIYEANFCQEFYAQDVQIQPFDLYLALVESSPTPFSVYAHWNNRYIMGASPERYLRKVGDALISQPIKGTVKRGSNPQSDKDLKSALYYSEKDRSENVMIVDLVRNDLSITASPNSVFVDELFGIYSFSNVHQMISTVRSKMETDLHFTDVLRHSFPMGSMTGAPKIMAMKLIEKFEQTQRGLYSGSIGYITPDGDFDFNVIIRSMQYNAHNRYLSYMVGGAITINSNPSAEYQECEMKAAPIRDVLNKLDKS